MIITTSQGSLQIIVWLDKKVPKASSYNTEHNMRARLYNVYYITSDQPSNHQMIKCACSQFSSVGVLRALVLIVGLSLLCVIVRTVPPLPFGSKLPFGTIDDGGGCVNSIGHNASHSPVQTPAKSTVKINLKDAWPSILIYFISYKSTSLDCDKIIQKDLYHCPPVEVCDACRTGVSSPILT